MQFDTLTAGATLLTPNAASPVIAGRALAISGNRIVFAGPTTGLHTRRAVHVLEADGRIVTPGFTTCTPEEQRALLGAVEQGLHALG